MLLVIVGYFIFELLASIKMGMTIGFGWSVIWVMATSFLGVFLLRLSQYAIMNTINHIGFKKFNMLSAQNAAISYIFGAILLIIPGIVSDFLGIILLGYTIYIRIFAKIPSETKKFNKDKGDNDVIDVEIIDSSSSDNTTIER